MQVAVPLLHGGSIMYASLAALTVEGRRLRISAENIAILRTRGRPEGAQGASLKMIEEESHRLKVLSDRIA